MKIVAYLYSDPLLESTPDPIVWGWEVDQIYQDVAIDGSGAAKRRPKESKQRERLQWQQLLQDCEADSADYLLVRRLEELGNSVEEVSGRLAQLESLGIQIIAIEQSAPFPTPTPGSRLPLSKLTSSTSSKTFNTNSVAVASGRDMPAIESKHCRLPEKHRMAIVAAETVTPSIAPQRPL